MAFMVGQVENIMGYYASIADNYGIAGATTGMPEEASSSVPDDHPSSSSP
jgi:hypothetical protein